jgi:drug/metabolite transporter (DMT)-like permease
MPKGFANPWLYLALNVLFTAISQLMLKYGASNAPGEKSASGLNALAALWTWGGIGVEILAFATWLYLLKYIPVGIAFAITNVALVLVPLGAWLILGETITPRIWVGSVLVMAGTFLVARSAARAEEKL